MVWASELAVQLAFRVDRMSAYRGNAVRLLRLAPLPDSPVRLVGEEEHRCPYCLELVKENDPRASVSARSATPSITPIVGQ